MSNASPMAITTTSRVTRRSARSAVLDEDRFEDVGRVLAGVDGLLQPLVDVLPADHRERVGVVCEERRDAVVREAVSLVLELAQLDQFAAGLLEALEASHRLGELRRRPADHLRLPPRLLADLRHAVG